MFRNKKNLLMTALAALIVVTSIMAVVRTRKGSNDFDTYYGAGKAALTHSGIYYSGEYYEETADVAPFLYAPVMACFFALFSLFPVSAAAVLWNVFNIALFGISLRFAMALMGLSWQQIYEEAKKRPAAGLASAAFVLSLFLDNLSMAQANVVIFFLLLASIYLDRRGKPFWAGFVLAAAILFKLTPLLFCLYFLFRRSGKALAGILIGLILLTAAVPAAVLGWENNRVAHRQWLGRTIKPLLVQWVPAWKNETLHPRKKTAEEIEHTHFGNLMGPKNQSLQAAAMRVFLKDRNAYADSTSFPIYAARKYRKMPVLIGIEKHKLELATRAVQLLMFLVLLVLSFRYVPGSVFPASAGVISLYFLSLTVFSPIARSHQFVSWIFPVLVFWAWKVRGRAAAFWPIGWACAVYFLQALPYGKAAGAGAWANLILWGYFACMTARPGLSKS